MKDLKKSINDLTVKLTGKRFHFNYDHLLTQEGREILEAHMESLGCKDFNVAKHLTEMDMNE